MASGNEKKLPMQERSRNTKQERHPTAKTGRKKNEFFDKLDVLEREYIGLEKERNILMFSRRSEFRKEHCGFEESEMKTMSERKTEKQHIKQQLTKIKVSVDKFQRELIDVKPTPAFVQKLKEMMEDIENCIMVFKDQQRKIYDDLISGERTTHQEIKSLEKKFESWSQLPAPTTAAAVNKKAANAAVATSMPPAIAAFEKFVVQTGGHQGGWDDYDHQLFLKLKAKHKNKEAFLSVAGSSIPGKSHDEVRQHHDWFQEYMELKESKRKAILEWRQHKEVEKDDFIGKTKEDEDEDDEAIRKRNEKLERERNERLAKLRDYKDQKEQDKAEMEERKQKEEKRKREEREKEEGRRLAQKAQVEEYARRRAEEEEIMKAAQEARQEQLRSENQLSAGELARIRERNSKMLEEKQSKIKAREEEIKEKQKRLEKLKNQVEVKAERDPSRLYKLTRGWEERRKDAQSGSGRGQVLHMPHRAVPSWRQGMS